MTPTSLFPARSLDELYQEADEMICAARNQYHPSKVFLLAGQTIQNGHIRGCAYDLKMDGHTIRYVPSVRKGRGRGLSVPPCICPADVCTDDECPDHGTRVFNKICGWHDEPPKGATRWR